MFQQRIAKSKELYLHEFLYPLMQGYDSIALNVDGEIGGNDQTFNMLVGRDLAKKLSGKEKFVVTTELLAGENGEKMGKTSGNMIAFTDTSIDCFGKVMSWPDEIISRGFELCTLVPTNEIPKGKNHKENKMRLAFEITSLIHSKKDAIEAQNKWSSAFSDGAPQDFDEVPQNGAIDFMIKNKIVESKSDLRRLISEGAVTEIESGKKQEEDFLKNPLLGKYRIGKHRFVKII
jgi:tyrosyl-tRNA synthetase